MEAVWTAVAHYFDRPFDPSDSPNWNVWPELTHVLVRGAMRRFLAKDRHPISAEFTAALIDQGFVHLPAAILYYHAQAHELLVQKDASLIPTLMDEQSTRDLIDIAGASFRARITGSRDWFLRSAHPLWITHMQDPQADAPWQQLSNPTTASQLYGIILLLMRTREDYLPFRPSAPGSAVNLRLTELVRMDALVDHWRRLRLDDPDLSSPITEANAFMVRQGRGSKARAGGD